MEKTNDDGKGKEAAMATSKGNRNMLSVDDGNLKKTKILISYDESKTEINKNRKKTILGYEGGKLEKKRVEVVEGFQSFLQHAVNDSINQVIGSNQVIAVNFDHASCPTNRGNSKNQISNRRRKNSKK